MYIFYIHISFYAHNVLTVDAKVLIVSEYTCTSDDNTHPYKRTQQYHKHALYG